MSIVNSDPRVGSCDDIFAIYSSLRLTASLILISKNVTAIDEYDCNYFCNYVTRRHSHIDKCQRITPN